MGERTAIVTGANRGIGKETALGLAKAGLTVAMACRDGEKALAARDEVRRLSGNERVFAYELDLSSIASIEAFGATFAAERGRLNVLVNNAGITAREYSLTPEGFESTISTNFLGPFFLTQELLPLFPAGEDDRIVNLSSGFYRYGTFSLPRLNEYRWVKAYAVSKYAVLLASLEWARRLNERGIAVNAVHPGVVRTGIMLTRRWYDAIINLILAPLYADEAQGARTSLHVALSEGLRGKTGGYYSASREAAIPERFRDPRLGAELFEYALERYAELKRRRRVDAVKA